METRPATGLRIMLVVALATVAALGIALGVRAVVGSVGQDNANGSVPVRGVGDLRGTWTAVNDVGAPSAVVPGSVVSLTFDGAALRVATGCNTLTGTVRVVDSTLVVEGLGGTEMGCEPALMRQEAWVAEMLRSRPGMELSGPTLSLLWDGHWLGLSSDPVR